MDSQDKFQQRNTIYVLVILITVILFISAIGLLFMGGDKEYIEGEDKRKPLTDEELAALLKEKGYVIARRTVAKYREQLEIPVARLRKEI